ncbi:MAG: hypothetical protein Q8O64_16510 [Sideroxyarcus sp.]|nr:hypothetical protein [Sideroxyarcus sp.]
MRNAPVMRFENALAAWDTPEFKSVLKLEMAHAVDGLPLQQGLTVGNQVTAAPITVVIHHVSATEKLIRVRAGIFYASVIGGCSCADDPTPVGENTEYCEVQLEIDRETGEGMVKLLDEH